MIPPGPRPALVAADLDGTLIGRDLTWAAGLPEALEALHAAGVRTVICTGRMLQSAQRVVARLGLTEGPVICYQGALVADLGSGEWLRHVPMERGGGRRGGASRARRWDASSTRTSTTSCYVEQVTDEARRYAEHVEVGIDTVDDLAAEVASAGRRRSWCSSRRRPTSTRSCRGCRSAGGDACTSPARSPTTSSSRTAPSARAARSPGSATAWASSARAVVALGDGMNDVDMLEWAGLGVAVAEAAEPVRAAADLVVPRADIPALLLGLAERASPDK